MRQEEPTVSQATPADLESLETIFARSFHPRNPNQRKWQPDTPVTRRWWRDIFAAGIDSPRVATFVAKDRDTNLVIGFLRMQKLEPNDKSAGFWTQFPWTEDHDKEACNAFTQIMVDAQARHLDGRSAYLLEVFGVDDEYQGRGLGVELLQAAVDRADDEGMEVLVEANANAKGLYQKFGFVVKEEQVLPGTEYRETVLVRPRKGA